MWIMFLPDDVVKTGPEIESLFSLTAGHLYLDIHDSFIIHFKLLLFL